MTELAPDENVAPNVAVISTHETQERVDSLRGSPIGGTTYSLEALERYEKGRRVCPLKKSCKEKGMHSASCFSSLVPVPIQPTIKVPLSLVPPLLHLDADRRTEQDTE